MQPPGLRFLARPRLRLGDLHRERATGHLRRPGTEIVTPDQLRIVDQTPEPTATLFACHPPGSTRQRIVVHLTLAA